MTAIDAAKSALNAAYVSGFVPRAFEVSPQVRMAILSEAESMAYLTVSTATPGERLFGLPLTVVADMDPCHLRLV